MKVERDEMRLRLRSLLLQAMALLTHEPSASKMTVAARCRARRAVLTICPLGESAPGEAHVGLWLSPLESAIWQSLEKGPLLGKNIARRTSQKFTPTFRAVLANLVHREVLKHCRETGYAHAGTVATPKGDTPNGATRPAK